MKRRGQIAIEFMMIFLFALILVSVLMYIFSYYYIDFMEQKNLAEVNEFASVIETEALILNRVHGGYNRTVEVPYFLVERFNISLQGPYLILTPFSYLGEDFGQRFYLLPGDAMFRVIHETGENQTPSYKLIIEKEHRNPLETQKLR